MMSGGGGCGGLWRSAHGFQGETKWRGGESLTGCKGRTIKNCLGSGKFYPHTPQARNNSRFLRNKDMLFRTVFFKRKKPRNKFIKVYFIDYTFLGG